LTTEETRTSSFGEGYKLSVVDRLGTWLSSRRLFSVCRDLDGKVLADIGCGFDARFGSSVLGRLDRLIAVDVSLSPAVLNNERITAVTGMLPDALNAIPTSSVDFVIMNSVLEHLVEPHEVLVELRRIARADSGVVFVNVPTWLGRIALETSAFRFKLSPKLEIDDHKRYYTARQLWQAMRDAGFMPSEMRVRRHKFGLNAYALCWISAKR